MSETSKGNIYRIRKNINPNLDQLHNQQSSYINSYGSKIQKVSSK